MPSEVRCSIRSLVSFGYHTRYLAHRHIRRVNHTSILLRLPEALSHLFCTCPQNPHLEPKIKVHPKGNPSIIYRHWQEQKGISLQVVNRFKLKIHRNRCVLASHFSLFAKNDREKLIQESLRGSSPRRASSQIVMLCTRSPRARSTGSNASTSSIASSFSSSSSSSII